MAEINLLKNELQDEGGITFHGPRVKAFYIVLALLILEVLTLAFFWIYGNTLENRQLELDRKEAAVDFEISKKDSKRFEAITHQARLSNLETLLVNHLYWSEVFKELESSTYKQASFSSLQVDREEHKFTLSGGVLTYTDMAKLLLGLQNNPRFTTVTLLNTGPRTSASSGYQFSLELTFDPRLLRK